MTREEAIQRFNGIINAMSISVAQSKFYPSKAELNELCDMAIEALSADTVSREFYEDAVKANIGLAKENCELKEQIESADTVQGEWEHWGSPFSDESEVIYTIVCSVCGARFIEPKDEPKGEYNYCPMCGTRMKGGGDK